MQILKLGGSVITHKDRDFSVDMGNVVRLAEEIADVGEPLIIVHGGGSFGHPVAEEYGIADGYVDVSQLIGFVKTHQAMVQLNKLITDALIEEGVPAFSLSPSSFVTTRGKRLVSFEYKPVQDLLSLGLTPVLFGDAVLDESQGFAILSGDQLIVELAKKLGVSRVILGSDVDGIFTDDPKLVSDAELIRELSLSEYKEKANVSEATSTDVTGGMSGKISEAAEAVRAGIPVVVINAGVPGRVRSALLGENVIGTRIGL